MTLRGLGRILRVAVVLWVAMASVGWSAELKRPVLSRIPPNYPMVAQRMHLEGNVVVEVTAMPDGSASQVKAVSGHPLLMQAAEDCVSHWRFMMMPKAERGTVTVVFSLSE
ncbi:MAG: energy transducer TonB [Edaphobacter sp.]